MHQKSSIKSNVVATIQLKNFILKSVTVIMYFTLLQLLLGSFIQQSVCNVELLKSSHCGSFPLNIWLSTVSLYDNSDSIWVATASKNGVNNSTSDILRYNISTNKMELITSVRRPIGTFGALAESSQNGDIYFFQSEAKLCDQPTSIYKFSTVDKNKPSAKLMMTIPCNNTFIVSINSAINVGNLIYLFGAYDSYPNSSIDHYEHILVYDITKNLITVAARIKTKQRLTKASVVWDGIHFYIFGAQRAISKFNPLDTSYEVLQSELPVKSDLSSALLIGNTALIISNIPTETDILLFHIETGIINQLNIKYTRTVNVHSSAVFLSRKNQIVMFPSGNSDSSNVTCISLLPPRFLSIPNNTVVVAGLNVTLRCGPVSGIPKPKLHWNRNGSEIWGRRYQNFLDGTLEINFVDVEADSGLYSCVASNILGKESFLTSLSVLTPTTVIEPGDSINLACNLTESNNSLNLEAEWLYYEMPINYENTPRISLLLDNTLIISNSTNNDSGSYTCVGKTKAGEIVVKLTIVLLVISKGNLSLIVPVPTPTPVVPGYIFPVILILIAIIVIGIFAFVFYRRKIRRKLFLTQEELRHFKFGRKGLATNKMELNKYDEASTNDHPYDASFEVAYKKMLIDKSKILGSGVHGVVYKGCLSEKNGTIDAAFKTTKTSDVRNILAELKILIYIGHHPNVIRLLGASTAEIMKGQVYIAVEFCENGCLESFLRNIRNRDPQRYSVLKATNNYENLQQCELDNETPIHRFNDWSLQIAKGMNYLSSKKIIHSDLATRNVLVSKDISLRITDFGLSRRISDYEHYVKKTQEALPWKWMALESLAALDFSSKSDVWSFGVTLWEIYSLGDVPYAGLSWNTDFVQMLRQGFRLSSPVLATEAIYKNMTECWHNDPKSRHSFQDLEDFFQQIVSNYKGVLCELK